MCRFADSNHNDVNHIDGRNGHLCSDVPNDDRRTANKLDNVAHLGAIDDYNDVGKCGPEWTVSLCRNSQRFANARIVDDVWRAFAVATDGGRCGRAVDLWGSASHYRCGSPAVLEERAPAVERRMRSVTAYATGAPSAAFEKTTIERRDLLPTDVSVAIAFAGVCHSDIHTARGEWGDTIYPLVPGHEITGVVDAVGSDVTKFEVGDRVGVGVIVDSCRACPSCDRDLEQYCENGATETYGVLDRYGKVTHGGYSTHIVTDEHFVLHVPDGLGLDVAAPLLCAGITVYSPLRHWGAGPGKRVAVVGLGGLGHLAVKFAHAMGAEVTVLSQSMAKQEDAKRLGADRFFATNDAATFDELRNTFDLIVSSVSVPLDMSAYLKLLRLDGAFVWVGLPPEPMSVKANQLLDNRRSLAGSGIGGMAETQEMLDFCAEHNIGADIETISAAQIDEAWDRVVASDVRYRFVIDTSTM